MGAGLNGIIFDDLEWPLTRVSRSLYTYKVYSAFHPSGAGKWIPAAAGKAKAGMAHSNDKGVGVQVKLSDPLSTRAIPERFCGVVSLRRGAISSVPTFTFTFRLHSRPKVVDPIISPKSVNCFLLRMHASSPPPTHTNGKENTPSLLSKVKKKLKLK